MNTQTAAHPSIQIIRTTGFTGALYEKRPIFSADGFTDDDFQGLDAPYRLASGSSCRFEMTLSDNSLLVSSIGNDIDFARFWG